MTATVSKAWRRTCRAARRLRREDLGASALEWAIIAAVMVVAATAVGAVIIGIVNNRKDDLQQCTDIQATATCGDQTGGGGGAGTGGGTG